MKKQNLERRAEDFHKIPPLVFCDKKNCEDRGEYIKCYNDNFKECDKYDKKQENNN